MPESQQALAQITNVSRLNSQMMRNRLRLGIVQDFSDTALNLDGPMDEMWVTQGLGYTRVSHARRMRAVYVMRMIV